MSIYSDFVSKPTIATLQDMVDAFKTMDREGNGAIPGAMLRNVVTIMGDKMTDADYDQLLAKHEHKETGEVKFEVMIKDVLSGVRNS